MAANRPGTSTKSSGSASSTPATSSRLRSVWTFMVRFRDERRIAVWALELNDGNYTATAKGLGIAINTLKAYLAGE
jgi:hypothetical protein